MRIRPIAFHATLRPRLAPNLRLRARSLVTLAIESSCDDTSVAVLEKSTCPRRGTAAVLHFHKKVTANNTAFNGVHPLVSLDSHQQNLAKLVAEAIEALPMNPPNVVKNGASTRRLPDFISVTRGPGMRSNLSTGIDTAKGLSVAWQIPLIGVHHMQAHALTPRLADALDTYNCITKQNGEPSPETEDPVALIKVNPDFPFLSVLASGGHTLLIHSASLTDHDILASTTDIAIGECLDKIARAVLPPEVLQKSRNTMYGALLEEFAFPVERIPEEQYALPPKPVKTGAQSAPETLLENSTAAEYRQKYEALYAYSVPKNHEEALKRNVSRWGWGFNQPLAKAAGGLKSKTMEMSFSGLMTAVERVVRYRLDHTTGKLTKIDRLPGDITVEERKDLAEYAMRAAFEHVASRVVLGLQQTPATTVVMAGGVAANSYLRYILASTLCAQGYEHVNIVFPPPSLCCDNAAMIAWTGIEMYQHDARDSLSIRAVRKWPLDQLLSPPHDRTPRTMVATDTSS